jgi:hypothetical protein
VKWRRVRDPWTDPFSEADTDVTDEFRPEVTEETTGGGFTALESGLGGPVTQWIDREVTDPGQTAMRIPDAEQQTMLYGRSFDAMRANARARVLQTTGRDLGPSPVMWVGVFGTMIAAVLTALALVLLMVWFALRAAMPPSELPMIPDPVPLPTPSPAEAAAPSPLPEPVAFPASFAFNDWTPQDVDRDEVERIAALAKRCPRVVIVTGHADGVGGEGVNERFALARAAGARDLLAEAGVPKARMVLASAVGAGRRVAVACP